MLRQFLQNTTLIVTFLYFFLIIFLPKNDTKLIELIFLPFWIANILFSIKDYMKSPREKDTEGSDTIGTRIFAIQNAINHSDFKTLKSLCTENLYKTITRNAYHMAQNGHHYFAKTHHVTDVDTTFRRHIFRPFNITVTLERIQTTVIANAQGEPILGSYAQHTGYKDKWSFIRSKNNEWIAYKHTVLSEGIPEDTE